MAFPNLLAEPYSRLMMVQPQLAKFGFEANLSWRLDKSIPTMMTNFKWVKVNPDFLQECGDGRSGTRGSDIFGFAHELAHNLLMHYAWMRSLRRSGILVTPAILKRIAKHNPDTKWREGMRLFHLPGPEAYAMDFVINDLLVTWGMKITPYGIAHDPSMITWKDSEDLSYATLFGVHGIEPEDRKDECRAAGKCPAGDRLGAGQPDTVDEPGGGAGGDPDDDPPERPHELMRRKMQVEKCLKEKQLAMGKSGADMQMLIDRLVPSRVNWRNFVETNVKAAAGRVSTTWRRTKLRAMTVQAVLPGRQDERTGVLVLQNDTSGSVGREEKEQYAGHVVGVMRQLRPKRIIMLDTDHEVQQVREPASLDELKSMLVEHGYKGGGGTSMEAGFDWCKANDITPDCVITLTDGYTSWPRGHAPAKRALWCITTPGIKAPEGCGVSVYMPLDNP